MLSSVPAARAAGWQCLGAPQCPGVQRWRQIKVDFGVQSGSAAGWEHRWVCAASLPLFPQVTTFSRLLTSADAACLEREVQGKVQRPQILFLQQFDTEYSFLKGIR